MLWILFFVRVKRPIHMAVALLKSGFNAARGYAGIGKIISMKHGVIRDPGPLHSPARETFPPRFEFFGCHRDDGAPRLGQIVNHEATPYVAMPEVAKILPRKSVQAQRVGKRTK